MRECRRHQKAEAVYVVTMRSGERFDFCGPCAAQAVERNQAVSVIEGVAVWPQEDPAR